MHERMNNQKFFCLCVERKRVRQIDRRTECERRMCGEREREREREREGDRERERRKYKF